MGATGPNNHPRLCSFILSTNSVLDVGDSTVIKTKSQPSRNSGSFGKELQYKETDCTGVQWGLVEEVAAPYWESRVGQEYFLGRTVGLKERAPF